MHERLAPRSVMLQIADATDQTNRTERRVCSGSGTSMLIPLDFREEIESHTAHGWPRWETEVAFGIL